MGESEWRSEPPTIDGLYWRANQYGDVAPVRVWNGGTRVLNMAEDMPVEETVRRKYLWLHDPMVPPLCPQRPTPELIREANAQGTKSE